MEGIEMPGVYVEDEIEPELVAIGELSIFPQGKSAKRDDIGTLKGWSVKFITRVADFLQAPKC